MGNIIKKKIRSNKATRTQFTPITIIMLIVLVLYVLSLFGLFAYCLLTALKCGDMFYNYEVYERDYLMNPYGFPKEIYFNFSYVFEHFRVESVDPINRTPINVGLLQMFGNSILYAFGCSFANTFVICLTAYGCARFPYKFSKVIYMTVIIVMIIPIIGNQAAELEMAIRFGLYNKIWGMWIMRANFLGMYFLVFYDIFKALPVSYTEAAKMDGANNWLIFFKIIFPLVINTFFTVLLINFIAVWNDYQVPLLYLPSYPTVAYGLQQAVNSKVKGMETRPMAMTAALIVLLPILFVFLLTQKRLLGNLTIGGVKA